MAIKDLFLRFRKQIETSETIPDDQLKTHFYKGTFNQIFTSVEQIFRQDADCRISTVSKEHGELAIEINKPLPCFLVVTVVSAKPLETAVDFTISTERTALFGTYPILKQRITTFYDRLNKKLTLVRTAKKL